MKMEELPKKLRRPGRKRRWSGAIEGIHRGLLYGWVVDNENLLSRVVVEICLNGEPVGAVIADVSRTDIQLPEGTDPCHGFVADLGQVNSAGTLTARVANTDQLLSGALAWNSNQKPPQSATSNVFSDGGLQLQGWVIDPVNDKRHVQVFAYVGEKCVASAVANLEHPAVRDVGKHGFSLSLPLAMADGALHTVRVVDHNGIALNGSPLAVCVHSGGARALLPEQAPQLLDTVIGHIERYVPRSLGFQHYHDWSAMFEPGANQPVESALKVGVILTGTGAAATKDSIAAQTHPAISLFEGKAFAAMVKEALAAGCDVLACVRPGDVLPPHALATALEGFRCDAAELVYTDSEFRGQPWFKPAWNADYAFGSDYPLDLLLISKSAIDAKKVYDNAAQLAWRAIVRCARRNPASIVHVPRVLYIHGAPVPEQERTERAAAAAEALAVLEPGSLLEALPVTVDTGQFQPRRLSRTLTKKDREQLVSLIIPTRDSVDLLKRCIESVLRHTEWTNLEIVVIDNGSVEAKTKTYFRKIAKAGVRVLPMPGPFNFSDLNNCAIEAAAGDIVVMMNNDIEALHDGWLEEMVAQLMRPGVGAVGAKLLWPNGMVQHGGILMGVGNAAGHFGNQLTDEDFGDHGRNQLVQQLSGVTAACLAIRKAHFLGLGGMDAAAFPVAFNDVDFCLRLRSLGKLIVWTPFARLLHAESASRGKEDSPQKQARARRELDQLRARWHDALVRDPAYHPSLNLDPFTPAHAGLALPPRDRSPRTGALPITQAQQS